MEYFFKIDVMSVDYLSTLDKDDSTVSEAIYTIYPFNDEKSRISLIWNNQPIILDFKMEISDIYNDIVNMMNFLMNKKNIFEIYFGCSSFMAEWQFSAKEDILQIDSYWTTVGNIELRERLEKPENSKIIINREYFINEWMKVLVAIKKDLQRAGYTDLEDIEDLNKIINYYN